MNIEIRMRALEWRCRMLTGTLVCFAVTACAALLMGAADSGKPAAEVVAKAFTLVDGKGQPRARLYTSGDNAALTLLRANGEVGAWLQVTDDDATFNISRPGEAHKTGVLVYASKEREGIGITSPDGHVRWHTPE